MAQHLKKVNKSSKLYANLKEFKSTEKEIKQLELLDMNECQSLQETFYKTNTQIHADDNMDNAKVMIDDGFNVMIKNHFKNTDFALDLKDWRKKIDLEIKEVQSQLKKDMGDKTDEVDTQSLTKEKKKKKKLVTKTCIQDDSLVKFSKLLINTKRLSVVGKFIECLEQFLKKSKSKETFENMTLNEKKKN